MDIADTQSCSMYMQGVISRGSGGGAPLLKLLFIWGAQLAKILAMASLFKVY